MSSSTDQKSIYDSRRQDSQTRNEHQLGCNAKEKSFEDRLLKSNRSVQSRSSANAILVNQRQKGNPLLNHIRNVPIAFDDDIIPDFVLGCSSCALFLSVRYHLLYPDYLEERMNEIGREYRTRLIICFADVEDNISALQRINLAAVRYEFTLILSWSWYETARYLETFRAYENKSASWIKEKVENEYFPMLQDILMTARAVTKTDVSTLGTTFKSLSRLLPARVEALALCPGLGEKKVSNLYQAFNEPFY